MNQHPPPDAGQEWDARVYAWNARFVAELGADVLAWLEPRAGERILDLGCGDGALTVKLVEAGAEVVAIDASESMVEAARARGLDARWADARRLEFSGEFDAVFSNAVLHWIGQADEVIGRVARALKQGGRFAGEMGGHGNVASIVVALSAVLRARGVTNIPKPWYFPTAQEYRSGLEAGGFTVERIGLFGRPTPLPTGPEGWLETFAEPYLGALPPDERASAAREAIKLLQPVLEDSGGCWSADYVRLRFRARKL
jgi:SAM-dependent methyltransferase